MLYRSKESQEKAVEVFLNALKMVSDATNIMVVVPKGSKMLLLDSVRKEIVEVDTAIDISYDGNNVVIE